MVKILKLTAGTYQKLINIDLNINFKYNTLLIITHGLN